MRGRVAGQPGGAPSKHRRGWPGLEVRDRGGAASLAAHPGSIDVAGRAGVRDRGGGGQPGGAPWKHRRGWPGWRAWSRGGGQPGGAPWKHRRPVSLPGAVVIDFVNVI